MLVLLRFRIAERPPVKTGMDPIARLDRGVAAVNNIFARFPSPDPSSAAPERLFDDSLLRLWTKVTT